MPSPRKIYPLSVAREFSNSRSASPIARVRSFQTPHSSNHHDGIYDEDEALLRLTFNLFDKDADGWLSKHEICQMLCALELVSYTEAMALLGVDGNEYDKIDFTQFVELVNSPVEQQMTTSDIDCESSYFVTKHELKQTHYSSSPKRNREDRLNMIKASFQSKMPDSSVVSSQSHFDEEGVVSETPYEKSSRKSVLSRVSGFFKNTLSPKRSVSPMRIQSSKLHAKEQRSSSFRKSASPINIQKYFERKLSMPDHYKLPCKLKEKEENELRMVFDYLDGQHKGFVTQENLHSRLCRIGIQSAMSESEIVDLFKDVSTTGRITFSQFQELYRICS